MEDDFGDKFKTCCLIEAVVRFDLDLSECGNVIEDSVFLLFQSLSPYPPPHLWLFSPNIWLMCDYGL